MKNLRLIAARTPRHTRTPYERNDDDDDGEEKQIAFYSSIICITETRISRIDGKEKWNTGSCTCKRQQQRQRQWHTATFWPKLDHNFSKYTR